MKPKASQQAASRHRLVEAAGSLRRSVQESAALDPETKLAAALVLGDLAAVRSPAQARLAMARLAALERRLTEARGA
jgi:hypothetical protein